MDILDYYLLIPTAKENFGRHNILEQQKMGGQESTMKLRYKSLSNNMNTWRYILIFKGFQVLILLRSDRRI